MRLGFRDLCERKFRHNFENTLNPLFSYSIKAEAATHYSLRFHFYKANRATIMTELENIPISFSTVSDNNLLSLLLYGNDKFNNSKNREISILTLRFNKVLQTLMGNFDENLIGLKLLSFCWNHFGFRFVEKDFVLPFQRASFTRDFTLGFFLL